MTALASDEFIANLLSSALMYAAGDLPVFPVHSPRKIGVCDCGRGESCDSPAKHPRTPNGFKDASCDELTIRRWWKDAPRSNVAIAVPSGYVVLDVDGQTGLDGLAEAGYEIPMTPTATTGKGWHYWFKTETDLPPRANMLPKVDLRGPASYVVAPPSLHVTGRQYRWELAPSDCEFAQVPDWLRDLAQQHTVGNQADGQHIPLDMSAILAGVPEGRRDQELFRAASKLRYADVPYEWAIQAVAHAAELCTPPMDAAFARAKVDSAYGRYKPSIHLDAGQGEAQLLSEDSVRIELSGPNGPVEFVFSEMEKAGPSLDAELGVHLLMPGTTEDRYVQRINLLSHSARDSCRRELESIFGLDKGVWAKLLNRAVSQAQQMYLGVDRSKRVRDIAAPSQLEYIIDGLIPEERPTVLFGAGSASKTMLCMSMMLAVSRGVPWLGRPTQKRNCLLIDYETGEATAGYRFGRLAQSLGLDHVPDNIHHWWSNGIPLPDQVEALRRCIATHNIGFVVLDHCGAACGGEPERSESALRFYRAASKLRVPMLAIAHVTGDAEANPDLVRRPFGSVYWSNGSSMTWYIRREDQEEESDEIRVGLFARKYNDSARPQDFGMHLVFDGRSGPISVKSADLRESSQLTGSRGNEHIIHDMLDQPLTVSEVAKATGINVNTVKTTLTRHKGMFENIESEAHGGRGRVTQWKRRESVSESVYGAPLP